MENHVRYAVGNQVLALAVGADELATDNMGLNSGRRYVEEDAVEPTQELLILLGLLRGLFGEILLPQQLQCLVQSCPIQFLDAGSYPVAVKLCLPIHGFFDIDDQWEVVLVAFGHIADHEVMRQQPHTLVDQYYNPVYKRNSHTYNHN